MGSHTLAGRALVRGPVRRSGLPAGRPLRRQPTRAYYGAVSTDKQNGAAQREVGGPRDGGDEGSMGQVEMFVARSDRVDPGGLQNDSPARARLQRRSVPPPRSASLQLREDPQAAAATLQRRHQLNSSRALRAELGVASAELQLANSELARTQQALRQEVADLRGKLAARDMRLRAARGELMEAQLAAREKDAQLQGAYEQLTVACRERAELRTLVIDAQAQLAEAHAELAEATDNMQTLKTMMESADEEEADPGVLARLLRGSTAGTGASSNGASVRGAQKGDSAADGARKMLSDLAALSQQVALEARQDEHTYRTAHRAERWRALLTDDSEEDNGA